MNVLHLTHQHSTYLLTVVLLAASALFLSAEVSAQSSNIFIGGDDMEVEVTKRLNPGDADFAMKTREGSVHMMLAGDAVIIQFSDQFFEDLNDEVRHETDYEEASIFGDIFASMITSGVQTVLDHALSIPLSEFRKVYYTDGKIHMINHDGEDIFAELEIDGVYVMEDFSRREARQFVSNVERRMY